MSFTEPNRLTELIQLVESLRPTPTTHIHASEMNHRLDEILGRLAEYQVLQGTAQKLTSASDEIRLVLDTIRGKDLHDQDVHVLLLPVRSKLSEARKEIVEVLTARARPE